MTSRRVRRAVQQCVTAALVCFALPQPANAGITRFEGRLSLFNSHEGTNLCPLGSACASAFEAATGITPSIGEFALGRLRFAYDQSTASFLPGASLALYVSPHVDAVTYPVAMSSYSAGGTDLTACYTGVGFLFTSSAIGGRVTYCAGPPVGDVIVPVTIDDLIASPMISFGGGTFVNSIGDRATWSLWTYGSELRKVSAPGTGSLALLAMAAFVVRRRGAACRESKPRA